MTLGGENYLWEKGTAASVSIHMPDDVVKKQITGIEDWQMAIYIEVSCSTV